MGGNEKFKDFMENYGPEGGYTKGMGMQEKYNSWAAAQYREKVSDFFRSSAVPMLIHHLAYRRMCRPTMVTLLSSRQLWPSLSPSVLSNHS